jgi:hypothetical protein
MTETALEKARRKFEQAKAALDAVKARETAAERKKDTRRKIVLGGALLELAKTDKEASALVSRLIAGLTRDHDKRVFEKASEKGSEKDVRKGASEPKKGEAPIVATAQTAAAEPAPPEDRDATPAPGYFDIPIRRDRERI